MKCTREIAARFDELVSKEVKKTKRMVAWYSILYGGAVIKRGEAPVTKKTAGFPRWHRPRSMAGKKERGRRGHRTDPPGPPHTHTPSRNREAPLPIRARFALKPNIFGAGINVGYFSDWSLQ